MSSAMPASGPPLGYVGRTLGGFRLVREIAAGGMATVYLGYKVQQAGVRQLAAVKVIHPHLAGDQDFIDMFLDEARIASYINHPHVCRVLDFGKADGTYYLAMEYLMGETWADVLKRMSESPQARSMIVPVLAQVLSQACEGLHAAHVAQDSYGNPLRIVHRDVSPYNVMVGYDGSVRVLDFGIASAADRLHTTRSGAVKGRLAYMAPEQMRGLAVDARADIWSLGVMLWEGLAQRRLFPGTNDARIVYAVTQEPIPSLAGTGHPIPATLQRVVSKALQRDCNARYPTARALGLDLSGFRSEWTSPAGMAEVSEWMHRLFEADFELKLGLLREGADGASGPVRCLDAASLAEGAASGTREPDATRVEGRTDSSALSSNVRRIALPARPREHRLLAVVAACLVFLFFVVLLGRKSAPGLAQKRSQSAAVASAAQWVTPTPGTARPETPVPEAKDELDLVFSLSDVDSSQEVPRPGAMARPVRMGQVSIATSGAWADVYLGARKLGTTPARLSLPEGVHTLRLRRLGKGPEIVRRVTVRSDAASRLKVQLD